MRFIEGHPRETSGLYWSHHGHIAFPAYVLLPGVAQQLAEPTQMADAWAFLQDVSGHIPVPDKILDRGTGE